jgi:hypothetical protein
VQQVDLRHSSVAVALAGLVLTGCGEDRCTSSSACPSKPTEIPSQEHWRLAYDNAVTIFNKTLDDRDDAVLVTDAFDLFASGPEDTCDTTTSAACSQIDVVFSMRLPTIVHKEPETGEPVFVTKDAELTVFGTLSLDSGSEDENVYGAAALDTRTCSRSQTLPPDGPFRAQGHEARWTPELEFRVSRTNGAAALTFAGMPLTLTGNDASCETFSFDVSGNLALER